MESNDMKTAAICGLFCETCPKFPAECEGCLSEKLAPHCRECAYGFRECAAEHGITRCFECPSFPCERLERFKDAHIVNGISHHEKVIEDLQYMRDVGVGKWVARKREESRCRTCGALILWHERDTHTCTT